MKKQKPSSPEKETTRKRLADVRDIFYDSNIDDSKCISLAEGGCFLPPPLPVLKKFIDSATNLAMFPHQIYPQQNTLPEFIKSVQNYFINHCKIPLNEQEDSVIFGFGSSHIFDTLLSVLCSPGDIILLPESYYHAFAEWPAKWQTEAVCIPTSEKIGYKVTAENIIKWFQENPSLANKVKCLVLTSPTSTGAIYNTEELESISTVVNHYGIHVYSDEVFRDTVFPGEVTVSTAAIPSLKPWTITASSGSKSRSVADLRIGWACGPKAIIDQMIWHMEHSVTEIPLYLQALGKAILDEVDEDFLSMAALEYQERIRMVIDLVNYSNKRLNLHFNTSNTDYIRIPYIPQAGYCIMLDFESVRGWVTRSGKPIIKGQDLCRYMYYHCDVNEKGEQINHGIRLSSGYSKGHDNFIMYMALAQPGYKLANDTYRDYAGQELLRHLVTSFIKPDVTSEQLENMFTCLGISPEPPPQFKNAALSGQREIVESFDRIVCFLKTLRPA